MEVIMKFELESSIISLKSNVWNEVNALWNAVLSRIWTCVSNYIFMTVTVTLSAPQKIKKKKGRVNGSENTLVDIRNWISVFIDLKF